MKKIIFSLLFLLPLLAFPQDKNRILDETNIKRISVGIDVYQDFWFNWPSGMDVRAVNQGAGGFVMYNIPIGKSPLSFCVGAGITCHNLFSDTRIG